MNRQAESGYRSLRRGSLTAALQSSSDANMHRKLGPPMFEMITSTFCLKSLSFVPFTQHLRSFSGKMNKYVPRWARLWSHPLVVARREKGRT